MSCCLAPEHGAEQLYSKTLRCAACGAHGERLLESPRRDHLDRRTQQVAQVAVSAWRRAPKNPSAGMWPSAWEYCRGICRTHSASTMHENAYISTRHHCFSTLGRPLVRLPVIMSGEAGARVSQVSQWQQQGIATCSPLLSCRCASAVVGPVATWRPGRRHRHHVSGQRVVRRGLRQAGRRVQRPAPGHHQLMRQAARAGERQQQQLWGAGPARALKGTACGGSLLTAERWSRDGARGWCARTGGVRGGL